MTLPGTLVCTVGTSLFYPNMKMLDPEKSYQGERPVSDPTAVADWDALEKAGLLRDPKDMPRRLREIKDAYESSMYGRLAGLLVKLPPELRLCGAEINSIAAMVKKGFLPENRQSLILLVSDTTEGSAIGEILSRYFEASHCPIRFERCEIETVSGLQDEQPLLFQREGLPNLVRLLGKHYRKWGGTIAINATGGYKAQIALAVAFGQAAGSTVYYKHERFDQIIRFPQIPFTLDLSLVEEHKKLWADLAEPGASFDRQTINTLLPPDENFREQVLPLLESIEEGPSSLYSLSALGMVYWETFLSKHPDLTLRPSKVSARRGCRFRDDHYPIGFKEHVERFYKAFPDYVSECHSMPYDGQAAIENTFYIYNKQIIGGYLDKNRFGARFAVMSSAENQLERQWLVQEFNKWLQSR
ncbi:MAG: putative CRISPR-associated protein [Thermodesulfobacteriota bacterium]